MRTRAQAIADRKELWRQIDREQRAEVRRKLAELEAQIREARRRRTLALREAKERCRTERLAARERARALRIRLLEEMREAVRAERLAARQTCAVRRGEARAIKNDIQRARATYSAERQYQQELRRIERANKQRRLEAPRATRLERRSESDDEVRQNIPPELAGMFERVKKSIKATPRMSRTEAFLRYAEEHPSEVLDAIEDKTEALIRELEQQTRAAAREMKRPRRRAAPREAVSSMAYSEVPF